MTVAEVTTQASLESTCKAPGTCLLAVLDASQNCRLCPPTPAVAGPAQGAGKAGLGELGLGVHAAMTCSWAQLLGSCAFCWGEVRVTHHAVHRAVQVCARRGSWGRGRSDPLRDPYRELHWGHPALTAACCVTSFSCSTAGVSVDQRSSSAVCACCRCAFMSMWASADQPLRPQKSGPLSACGNMPDKLCLPAAGGCKPAARALPKAGWVDASRQGSFLAALGLSVQVGAAGRQSPAALVTGLQPHNSATHSQPA